MLDGINKDGMRELLDVSVENSLCCRYTGASSVFGSNIPNVEQWRVGSTLRGHSGGKKSEVNRG